MRINVIWIFFLILPYILVNSQPIQQHQDLNYDELKTKPEGISESHNKQVISVRITSSVAVGRGKGKNNKVHDNTSVANETLSTTPIVKVINSSSLTTIEDIENVTGEIQDHLGANIDFIKQLQARKETRGVNHLEHVNPFESINQNSNYKESNNYTTEFTTQTVEYEDVTASGTEDNIDSIPLARSVSSLSAKNYVQSFVQETLNDRESDTRLTTVSFHIVHDKPKIPTDYQQSNNRVLDQRQTLVQVPKIYNEPAKVYSEPAKIYSEPAKFYSEPAKFYSEPAKIYSEPAKVYSEPAKIYSEPAKFYSQPASLHLTPQPLPNHTPWRPRSQTVTTSPSFINTDITTPPITTVTYPTKANAEAYIEHQPEKNYEVDEKISLRTDGRSHGVQQTNENCKQENCKVGYVVEGRQFKKYRVEERTSDGFIVGEYGVVRNEDGALRGVRYTADSEASPRLIQDALMKFLQLK